MPRGPATPDRGSGRRYAILVRPREAPFVLRPPPCRRRARRRRARRLGRAPRPGGAQPRRARRRRSAIWTSRSTRRRLAPIVYDRYGNVDARRHVRPPGPRAGEAEERSAGPHRRGDLDRGPQVLRAPRRRPRRLGARAVQERRRRRDLARRQHDHAAARQEHVEREPEARPEDQGARGGHGDAARARADEEPDPRGLPEPRLLRERRVRRAGRGRALLPEDVRSRSSTSRSRRCSPA